MTKTLLDSRHLSPALMPATVCRIRCQRRGGRAAERTAAAIRVVVTEDATTAPGLLADVEDAVVEVEVRPAETDDLAPAEAHGDREHDCTTRPFVSY